MIRSKGQVAFQVFDIILLSLLGIAFVVPYLLILSASFTEETSFLLNGYKLIPLKWSFAAYKTVFSGASGIFKAFGSSLFITVAGTVIQVSVTTLAAYSLTRRGLKGKNVFIVLMLFAMLFSGGLIPSYIWIAGTLKLRNSYFAIFLPSAFNIWNCILTMNFLKTIPHEMEEAAKIDGCGCFRLFFSIYLPVSVPIVATITLFAAVQYWNSWAEPTLYFDSNHRGMLPLVSILREMISEDVSPTGGTRGVSETVKMATTVVATLPIMLVYPFVQKYFMSGLMLGSVKG